MTIYITKEGILNESVFWHKTNKKFYWIDIEKHLILSFDPKNNIITKEKTTFKPCCIQPLLINYKHSENKIICASTKDIGYLDLKSYKFEIIDSIDENNVRFNDGKIDKNGVLHIGTMDIRKDKKLIGKIYKFENEKLVEIESKIGITNGISFDNNNMYFSDSLKKILFKKNLYNNTNSIIKIYDGEETPDGGIFFNNKYYSCIWGGSRIDIYKNDKIINNIKLQNKYITCCDFDDNNNLFVTCYFD